jgi:integrase
MGVYLRRGRYHYKRMIDGRRYYRSLGLKKGQESMLSARIKQIDDELTALAYGLPAPGRATTLSEYRKIYLKHKAHKKSLDRDTQRLDYLIAALPDIPMRQYRSQHFEDLEAGLREAGRADATINRYLELARHVFNCAIQDGILTANPLARWEPFIEDGTRRALSDDEIGKVLGALDLIEADKRFRNIRHVARDLILFALATGMRLSEILNLRHDQIQEDVITLPISATKSRRRGISKQRVKVVVLNDIARDIINRQPASADDYVFRVSRRHPNVVFYLSKKIREKSDVKDFTFHALRHTASTIISSHASLATARAILGHADIKTTLRYTHPGIEDQRASVAQLGNHISNIVCKSQKT